MVGQSDSKVNLLCSHLVSKSWIDGTSTTNNAHTYSGDNRIGISIDNEKTGIISGDNNTARINKFKAWLVAQYNAGTPLTVQYKLATPTEENIELPQIPTFEGNTNITIPDGGTISAQICIK